MQNPSALPTHLCYLNGAYTPLNEAKVSVLDRGFIFGDGVYEVLAVYGGRVFCFERHMQRLERSLREARITQPHTHEEWLAIATKLIATHAATTPVGGGNDAQHSPRARPSSAPSPGSASLLPGGSPGGGAGSGAGSGKGADVAPTANPTQDQLIYLQVTRGVAPRDHAMLPNLTPTVFAMINPMVPASPLQRAAGVACVTAEDFRWKKAHIKTTSLLGAVFARQISVDAGAVETVMFRDGFLSEAAASNVWIVKDKMVLGPVKDNLVLEGIRYGLIEEICRAQGLGFQLRPISRQEVLNCDELLLSSATKEVMAVTRLDDKPVGNGHPGPTYHALYAGYQTAKGRAN